MNKIKKFLGALTVMGMLLSLVISEQTVEAKDYTKTNPYKVRIFAGKQGTFAGGVTEMDYTGKTFDIGDIKVKLETAEDKSTYEKYYVKGIKPSGADLEDKLEKQTFTDLERDMDYVVVYGVRANMVEYTIYYLDANGNTLAPSKTYEGNVGDKPIVPYLYIEGYMPQAYNLTKTLVENEDNIFTFYYTRVTTGTGGGGGGDRTIYDEETVTTTNTTPVVVPGTGGDAAGGGGGVTVVPGDGGAADAGAGGGEAAAPAEPEQLVDLDDEEVPLANVPGSSGGGSGIGSEPGSFFVNMPPAVIVGIVSMAVLAVAAAWFLIFKRKKKGTDEDEQE